VQVPFRKQKAKGKSQKAKDYSAGYAALSEKIKKCRPFAFCLLRFVFCFLRSRLPFAF
jgi:hypothetical protein